jgi:hypothetical protein
VGAWGAWKVGTTWGSTAASTGAEGRNEKGVGHRKVYGGYGYRRGGFGVRERRERALHIIVQVYKKFNKGKVW